MRVASFARSAVWRWRPKDKFVLYQFIFMIISENKQELFHEGWNWLVQPQEEHMLLAEQSTG